MKKETFKLINIATMTSRFDTLMTYGLYSDMSNQIDALERIAINFDNAFDDQAMSNKIQDAINLCANEEDVYWRVAEISCLHKELEEFLNKEEA